MYAYADSATMAEWLRGAGYEADSWMTGGGIMNPVIIISRDTDEVANEYIMFSSGWSSAEASFTHYLRDESNGEMAEQDSWIGHRSLQAAGGFDSSRIPDKQDGFINLVDAYMKMWGIYAKSIQRLVPYVIVDGGIAHGSDLDTLLVGVEDKRGSHVACRVGVGESLSDIVGGLPACAVAGNDEVGGEGYQLLDGLGEN